MTPAKFTAIYLAGSIAFAAFARPGDDPVSNLAVLLGGSLGSLKLSVDSAGDIRDETLDAGHRFSREALAVSFGALIIWILGAWLTFQAARSRWKGGFLAGLIGIWVVGSAYNIFWFAIRSV